MQELASPRAVASQVVRARSSSPAAERPSCVAQAADGSWQNQTVSWGYLASSTAGRVARLRLALTQEPRATSPRPAA